MFDFDALIVGGGAAGMSCALALGSGNHKTYAKDKRTGIILHQKTSHLQSAVFNNVLGNNPGNNRFRFFKGRSFPSPEALSTGRSN